MSVQQDAYPLPRATGERAEETARLDGQHEMFKLVLGGKLTSAQLPTGSISVLDVGCGTGIWSTQFAAACPSAQVLGVDIVPPTVLTHSNLLVPANCKFAQADVEADWKFAEPESFDFVYCRLLVASIKDWKRLFSRVYDVLRPGGTFEIYEGIIKFHAEDGTTAKDSALMRWFDEFRDFVSSRGVDPDAPATFADTLKRCGFEVVYDQYRNMYPDPEAAEMHETFDNRSQVAVRLAEDLRSMMAIITEKALNSDVQRKLCTDALDDMAQNSGRRGYYAIHHHMVVKKPFKN